VLVGNVFPQTLVTVAVATPVAPAPYMSSLLNTQGIVPSKSEQVAHQQRKPYFEKPAFRVIGVFETIQKAAPNKFIQHGFSLLLNPVVKQNIVKSHYVFLLVWQCLDGSASNRDRHQFC